MILEFNSAAVIDRLVPFGRLSSEQHKPAATSYDDRGRQVSASRRSALPRARSNIPIGASPCELVIGTGRPPDLVANLLIDTRGP